MSKKWEICRFLCVPWVLFTMVLRKQCSFVSMLVLLLLLLWESTVVAGVDVGGVGAGGVRSVSFRSVSFILL